MLMGDTNGPQADSPGVPGWHVMDWKQVLGRAACWGVANGLGAALTVENPLATILVWEAAGAGASVCND
jgi:hypothetical protein